MVTLLPPPSNLTDCCDNTQAALVNLSNIISLTESQVEGANTLDLTYLKSDIVQVTLLTMFLGLYTVLIAVAAYILCAKGLKRWSTAAMLAAILVMWFSTIAYWVTTLRSATMLYSYLRDTTSQTLDQLDAMQHCVRSLLSTDNASVSCPMLFEPLGLGMDTYHRTEDCVGTAALTVNVILGDSIVLWRAWVLWPDNLIVRSVSVVATVLAIVMGALDTRDACVFASGPYMGSNTRGTAYIEYFGSSTSNGEPQEIWGTGSMLNGDVWGMTAVFLSLSTNIAATLLIAYRAWEHRRIIMSYLKEGSPRSQVERTLTLLVESGLLYCALWVFIAIYEISDSFPTLFASKLTQYGLENIVSGCLVPLVGMYPTLIIIVCAADKSLYERSTEEHAQNGTISFTEPRRHRYGTLSELLGASSVHTTVTTKETMAGDPESSADELFCPAQIEVPEHVLASS